MKNILEELKNRRLYFDGGTGTVLQKCGLLPGEAPEIMNRRDPYAV
jgi:5-methyltetrahydrofolate--homocysteine methyltransferase